MSSQNQSPFNSVPPVVLALCLVIMGIELTFSLGARGLIGGPQAVGWRLQALQEYGFGGHQLWWMIETHQWPFDLVKRFISYAFVNGSFTQAIFVCVFLLAMGKMVGEAMNDIAVIVIFVVSAIGGALVYGLVIGERVALIGGFPAVYGLIGAFTYLLWQSLANVGAQQSRAFSLIAFLMGVQLVFGLLFGGSPEWIADLAGFGTGFLMSFFLVPGGWKRIRARIRRE